MYAQYQQYGGSNGAATAVAGQAQVWNGQNWVPAAASYSGTHATYTQTQPAVVTASASTAYNTVASTVSSHGANNGVTPPNPTVTFTQYYHEWMRLMQYHQTSLNQLPSTNASLREDAQRRVGWCKYYADQSSRAAHYFHQNPRVAVAPFDLPPDPATHSLSANNNNNNTATGGSASSNQPSDVLYSSVQQHRAQRPPSSKPSNARPASKSDPRGSLQTYMKRCLDQCSSDADRKAMQSLVEHAIAKSIQEGVFSTKDWSNDPLLRLPRWSTDACTPPMTKNDRRKSNKRSSKGHKSAGRHASQSYDNQLQQNDSYYGRAAGSEAGQGTAKSDCVSPKQTKRRTSPLPSEGYYGPASSETTSFLTDSPAASRGSNTNCNDLFSPSSPLSLSTSVSSPRSLKNTRHNKKKRGAADVSNYGDEDFLLLPLPSSKKAKRNKNKKKQQRKQQGEDGLDRSTKAMADRANRFAGPGGIKDVASTSQLKDNYDRYMGKTVLGGSSNKKQQLDESDYEKMTVKGTCLVLEKEYLRLTAPPRAELVRPKHVLRRHVVNLKKEYDSNGTKNHDYLWFCSQFKAVRQDCTVQRIQDIVAVDAYEAHAKIALQQGDLNEYNQCQTQLKELYSVANPDFDQSMLQNYEEFVAYRLLYYVLLSTNDSYDGGSSDLLKIMLTLNTVQRTNEAIRHALDVRAAVAESDYHKFFQLHKSVPNLGRFLTDRIVPVMRLRALRRMAKAYRPSLKVDFCLKAIGFADDDVSVSGDGSSAILPSKEREEGLTWIKRCGAVVEGDVWMTKDSVIHEPVPPLKNSLI